MDRSMTMTAAFVVLAGAGAAVASELPGGSGTVFVTERQFGTLSALDAASGDVRWTTAVGGSPIGVTLPHGTGNVYTSDEGPDQVSVLDARTGVRTAIIPMGPDPHHLMAGADGRRLYVAEFGHNQVGVIDTALGQRVAGFTASPLADARTHAVWITNDGVLYATNSRSNRDLPGDVAKLDARTGALLCNTMVGPDPSEILVTADGRVGYVSVRRQNRVKELDLTGECPQLTGREAVVGTQPDTLRLTNDGTTLVVTLRGNPAQVSFLDTASFAVRIATIPGHTLAGHHWLSANGKFTFVAAESVGAPGSLVVMDTESGQVLADYPCPAGSRPHGVFFAPGRR